MPGVMICAILGGAGGVICGVIGGAKITRGYNRERQARLYGDLQALTESVPMTRSEVERFASKQRRKNIIPVNKDGRALTPGKCYDTLLEEGSETIFLVPLNEFPITHPLLSSLRLHYRPEIESNRHKKQKAAAD
jgi:hypothetical protein